jgi:hypothetical protein
MAVCDCISKSSNVIRMSNTGMNAIYFDVASEIGLVMAGRELGFDCFGLLDSSGYMIAARIHFLPHRAAAAAAAGGSTH